MSITLSILQLHRCQAQNSSNNPFLGNGMKIVDRTMKKTLTLNIQYVLRANGGGFYVRYLILHV